jgi:putative heme iron utilization protein
VWLSSDVLKLIAAVATLRPLSQVWAMANPDTSPAPGPAPGDIARQLLRTLDRGSLATPMRPDAPDAGAPYASLVLVAADHDASPLLLISALADHTKNLLASPAVSLLFDGTVGRDEPLTGPRVSVQGMARRTDDPRHAARFVGRHPGAAMYSGFKDFAFWRIEVTRAHLVAGFGRIHWLTAREVLYDASGAAALAGAEPDIVAHMNQDHADAVQLYATKLLGRAGDGWQLTGVDPEGADLRRGGEVARLPFDRPVADAEEARAELVRLVKKARAA